MKNIYTTAQEHLAWQLDRHVSVCPSCLPSPNGDRCSKAVEMKSTMDTLQTPIDNIGHLLRQCTCNLSVEDACDHCTTALTSLDEAAQHLASQVT